MKLEISKDWCIAAAAREGDAEVGAGFSTLPTPLSADKLRELIDRELDELMMGAENYFGAINPKRDGHIRCASDRIMAILSR